MKLIMLFFVSLFIGCSSHNPAALTDEISLLQTIWNSKDPSLALEKIQGLHKTEENDEYETLTIDNKNTIFSLAIYVSKKDRKIFSIKAPINNGSEAPASAIKSKLQTDDWKTYEHSLKGEDYIKSDVSEYSDKLGVAFVYEKLDKDKKVRMVYWGSDPKKIQTLF